MISGQPDCPYKPSSRVGVIPCGCPCVKHSHLTTPVPNPLQSGKINDEN